MSSYNDLIDSDPLERDPHEHEADADLRGIEDGDGDSDTDLFDEEPLEAFDGDDDTPGQSDQPQNEQSRTEKPFQRRDRTARDDEDTSRADDVDEEQETDEVTEYAEVDYSDETSILAEIYEEPQIYRAQFAAQEIALPDEDENPIEPAVFDAGYDALDDLDETPGQLDADPLAVFSDLLLDTDLLVALDPDDLSDPLAAFRWFSGESVFDEAGNDEWFTP